MEKLQNDIVLCEGFLLHCSGFARDSFPEELVLKDGNPEKHIVDGAHRNYLLQNMYSFNLLSGFIIVSFLQLIDLLCCFFNMYVIIVINSLLQKLSSPSILLSNWSIFLVLCCTPQLWKMVLRFV